MLWCWTYQGTENISPRVITILFKLCRKSYPFKIPRTLKMCVLFYLSIPFQGLGL